MNKSVEAALEITSSGMIAGEHAMMPVDVTIQRLDARLMLATHEPATWLWLAAWIAAIATYVVAVAWLSDSQGDLEGWLALVAGGAAFWIIFGWIVELVTLDARGHFSFILRWEYPVVFALPVAASAAYVWHVSRPKMTTSQRKPQPPRTAGLPW